MIQKFRAWDKQHECYFEATHRLMIRLDGEVYNSEYGEIQTDRFRIEAFTGLTTEDGTEIYGGDHIKAGFRGDSVKHIYLVEYDNVYGSWYGTPVGSNAHCQPLGEIRFGAEVVGNMNEDKKA